MVDRLDGTKMFMYVSFEISDVCRFLMEGGREFQPDDPESVRLLL